MENNYSFQKEYMLIPQSPVIHFQYETEGVTLRATEVKPKLDKYIIRHCENIPDNWKSPQTPNALNYRIRLCAVGDKNICEIGYKTDYDIYYGNMGDNTQKKKGVMVKTKLTVTSFNTELLAYIDKIIGDFFIVTNFGTMQSKGFGSFIVSGWKKTEQYICRVLINEYTKGGHCYKFNADPKLVFKQIKNVYSLIKSGINIGNSYQRSILFEYMHETPRNMGNEKAWLKQQKIAPALGKSKNQKDACNRYVRALFGISDSVTYKDFKDKRTIKIKEKSKTVERLNSPILFKVINNTVFFVGMEPNSEIYGKTFTFSSNTGSGDIDVPTKEELYSGQSDNYSFMNDFMEYACKKLNQCMKKFRDVQNLRILREDGKYV